MADEGGAKELIETHLQHLGNLKNNISNSLSASNQALPPLQAEWSTTRGILTNNLLPKLGPAVQFAARSMMAQVTSGLESLPFFDQVPNINPLRAILVKPIVGQLQELEQLLRNPPELISTQSATMATVQPVASDLTQAKTILSEATTEAQSRATKIHRSAAFALAIGIVVIAAAAGVPYFWRPMESTSGWPLVAAWGIRLMMVAALLVGAIQLINVFRDLIKRAAGTSREEALLRILAASTFLPAGREQAFIDLVSGLSQAQPDDVGKAQSLVVPGQLLKELPELVKLFKSAK